MYVCLLAFDFLSFVFFEYANLIIIIMIIFILIIINNKCWRVLVLSLVYIITRSFIYIKKQFGIFFCVGLLSERFGQNYQISYLCTFLYIKLPIYCKTLLLCKCLKRTISNHFLKDIVQLKTYIW